MPMRSDAQKATPEVMARRRIVRARRTRGAERNAAEPAEATAAAETPAGDEKASTAAEGAQDTKQYHHAKAVEAALGSAWLLLRGTLVMFTHAGCRTLETGCCRA